MKFLLKAPTLLSIALVAGVISQYARPAAAQQQLPPLPIEFSPDNLINPGRPGGRRRGGGSRGNCQAEYPLTAIAYADSRTVEELGVARTDEAVGALTTQDNPILWFYLPAPVQETAAELVLRDSREQVIFQGSLEGDTESSGIVGLELSDLPLESAYQWFLTIDCDEGERMTVNGWVERQSVGPDAARTLMQASDRNRVSLYASYGFLQDALTQLAQLRYSNPEDEAVAQEWQQFLTRLELPELSDAPILPCCLVAESSNPSAPTPAVEPPPAAEDTPPAVNDDIPEHNAPETNEPAEVEEDAPEQDSRSILQRARDWGN
ncbi:MAG: DUF928 domain-containing protein [Phormidesmis sp.]